MISKDFMVKWSEKRKQGKKSFIVKTGLIITLTFVLLLVCVLWWINIEENISPGEIITYGWKNYKIQSIIMILYLLTQGFIGSYFIWKSNEKYYLKNQK